MNWKIWKKKVICSKKNKLLIKLCKRTKKTKKNEEIASGPARAWPKGSVLAALTQPTWSLPSSPSSKELLLFPSLSRTSSLTHSSKCTVQHPPPFLFSPKDELVWASLPRVDFFSPAVSYPFTPQSLLKFFSFFSFLH